MFCHNCGEMIGEEFKFCPNCGAEQIGKGNSEGTVKAGADIKTNVSDGTVPNYNNGQQTYRQYDNAQNAQNTQKAQTAYNAQPAPATDDTGSIGWGVLGALIPLVGLILFLVWNSTKPRNAKVAGIGALVGVGLVILSYIITGAFIASNA